MWYDNNMVGVEITDEDEVIDLDDDSNTFSFSINIRLCCNGC